MNARLPILIGLIFFLYFCFVQTYPCLGQQFSKDSSFLLAKNGEGPSPKEDSRQGPPPAIEEYEKEKLAKIKRNIGRRLLTVKTINPTEFYESPDTMNFYQVKFDSGERGYLSADGNYLEIKIKEGSLISVPKRASAKKKNLSQSKVLASQAVELVKGHLTPAGSVEKRMMDEKTKSFPNLKWRYEAKEIGSNKYRVTQYAGEGVGPPLIRTWIVDLSTAEIKPENLAAKEMYR
ncbi:MAG: hypothetical protein ABSG71_17115 [Thermodesulfobacteriota bacterium]